MDTLVIKNGRFYRGPVEEKPEIGNAEQIQCLKNQNELGSLMKEGLIVAPFYEASYEASVFFNCVCGKKIYVSEEANDEDDVACFQSVRPKCGVCKKTYAFSINDDDELVVILQ